jgi:hypothetical protein
VTLNSGQKPKKTPTVLNLVWSVVIIAVAVYDLRHGSGSTFSLVTNIALLVLGVLLAVFWLLMKAAGPMGDPADAADAYAEQQRTLYGGLHEYREATEQDLRLLDGKFYDRATADLTAAGFRHMRDVVNVTVSSVWPRNLAVLRGFVGDHETTMAAAYHLRIFGPVRVLQVLGVIARNLRTIEFETELSDGTFVTTANDAVSNKSTGYPFIDRQQFQPDTPLRQMLESHRARLAAIVASRPGVEPVRIHNYTDYRAAQDRVHLLKSAHRRSPDFDYRAEWQKVAGRPLRPDEERMVDQGAVRIHSSPSAPKQE